MFLLGPAMLQRSQDAISSSGIRRQAKIAAIGFPLEERQMLSL